MPCWKILKLGGRRFLSRLFLFCLSCVGVVFLCYRLYIYYLSTLPHYMTVDVVGRLGNHLFQFASLLGIAERNKLIPLVSRTSPLRNMFKITADTTENHAKLEYEIYKEKKGCTYENPVMELGHQTHIMLKGYFQSWKYLTDADADIRQQLQFNDFIMDWAKTELLRITEPKKLEMGQNLTYIGVHVRRGDMVNKKLVINFGCVSPGMDYLNKAMAKFRSLYHNCVFVVASDDIPWCKSHLTGKDIALLDTENAPEQDLAVLTLCNHTLMTVGSFGWWAAWLTNGTTIYFTGYPRPGSELDSVFNAEDHIPNNWIGLS